MKDTPKALSVQDISCHGQCSNTVILPILSAAGVETVMLPTALLSTHTGGFQGYTFLDLTEEMEKILLHFTGIGLAFDYICTGYFGSAEQIGLSLQEAAGRAVSFVSACIADTVPVMDSHKGVERKSPMAENFCVFRRSSV